MKLTKTTIPPVPVKPMVKYNLELSEREMLLLAKWAGGSSTGDALSAMRCCSGEPYEINSNEVSDLLADLYQMRRSK